MGGSGGDVVVDGVVVAVVGGGGDGVAGGTPLQEWIDPLLRRLPSVVVDVGADGGGCADGVAVDSCAGVNRHLTSQGVVYRE